MVAELCGRSRGCAGRSRCKTAAGTSRSLPPKSREPLLATLHQSLDLGVVALKAGHTALNIVELVVRKMENCPHFNTGKGSVLTSDGTMEMEASILDGKSMRCGTITGTFPSVVLFLNFSTGPFESKSAYYGAAEEFEDKEAKFLIGSIDASQGAFQYFGLKEDQAPLILIQDGDSKKFLKTEIEPDHIVSWLKDYFGGKLSPFRKSERIPEANDEPVKVVVADNVNVVVFKSGKNFLIEFCAPWCVHCKKLAPILDEAATTLKSEEDVVIAKMDATANDVPSEFDVQGYPIMYFITPSGKSASYDGGRTTNEIVEYIRKNR